MVFTYEDKQKWRLLWVGVEMRVSSHECGNKYFKTLEKVTKDLSFYCSSDSKLNLLNWPWSVTVVILSWRCGFKAAERGTLCSRFGSFFPLMFGLITAPTGNCCFLYVITFCSPPGHRGTQSTEELISSGRLWKLTKKWVFVRLEGFWSHFKWTNERRCHCCSLFFLYDLRCFSPSLQSSKGPFWKTTT